MCNSILSISNTPVEMRSGHVRLDKLIAYIYCKRVQYTVRRVVGKTRHPDRMSQDQTGYVTEDVSGMDNGKIRPPGRQIPIHRKIPTFFRWLTLLAYIYFPMMSEISDTIFRLIKKGCRRTESEPAISGLRLLASSTAPLLLCAFIPR